MDTQRWQRYFNLMLTTPHYTQPETLAVTGLKAAVLQTWINRSAITLNEQNPGSGRRRHYSKLDVVKLAVMRRLADLNIDLSVSRDLAERTAETLLEKGEIDWNLHLRLRPRIASPESLIEVISTGKWAGYDPVVGDARNMRVADSTEWSEGVFQRRRKRGLVADAKLQGLIEAAVSGREPPISDQESVKDGEIDPIRRAELARRGIYAEPVIVFPLGEIVNGTLTHLQALDGAESDA